MPVGCWLCLARAQNPGSVGYKETEGGAPNEEVRVDNSNKSFTSWLVL